jgi:hypothetical protein
MLRWCLLYCAGFCEWGNGERSGKSEGNKDDLIGFMLDRNLPVDEIEADSLAEEILRNPPIQGFLTISNALQWRLQYGRVIERAGQEAGLIAVYRTLPITRRR